MDISLLEVSLGNITRTLICVGSGQTVCHIVGPSSFYLRSLIQAGLADKYTFTSCDPLWTSVTADQAAQDSNLATLLTLEYEIIQAIKKHFKQSKIGLLGFSAPGCLAINYALQYPEDVAWLKLVGIPIQGTDPNFSSSDESFKMYADKKRVEKFFLDQTNLQDHKTHSFYSYQSPNSPPPLFTDNAKAHHTWLQQTMAIYHKAFYTDNLRYQFAYFEHWKTNILGLEMNQRFRDHFFATILGQLDPLAHLKSLATRLPITLYNGKEDYITPMNTEIVDILERLPHLKVIHYDNCGHCPYIENSRAFYNDL